MIVIIYHLYWFFKFIYDFFPSKEPNAELENAEAQDATETLTETEILTLCKHDEKGKGKEDREIVKDADREKGKDRETEKKSESEKDKVKGLDGTNIEVLLQKLPTCVSRDLIDQLAVINTNPSYNINLYIFLKACLLQIWNEIHVTGRVLLLKFKNKQEKACKDVIQCSQNIVRATTTLLSHGCYTVNLHERCTCNASVITRRGVQFLNK